MLVSRFQGLNYSFKVLTKMLNLTMAFITCVFLTLQFQTQFSKLSFKTNRSKKVIILRLTSESRQSAWLKSRGTKTTTP